ncbi:hypothetical protein ACI4BF_28865, partial [Klebsiella pneumoniae]|uniref:hypothetical protein n=1 Tax=Klebsiella pneumoniae TaxID=573 RepID=UPI003851DBA2
AKIRVEAEEKIKLFSDPDYIKAMIDKQRAANEAHRAKIKMNKDYMSEWLAQEDYNGQEDNTYEFGTPEPPFEI